MGLYGPISLLLLLHLSGCGGGGTVSPPPASLAPLDAPLPVNALTTQAGYAEPGAMTFETDAYMAAVNGPEPDDREDAIELLAQQGDDQAIMVLSAVASDDIPSLRMAAAESLAEIGSQDATFALGRMLDDESAAVREAAVLALEEIGSDVAVGYLQQAQADSDQGVRASAAAALEELLRYE